MPRPDRGGPGGPGPVAPQDPALRLALLQQDRARLASAIGEDKAYEDLQDAQRAAADAQRAAQKDALAKLDELIASASDPAAG